VGLFLLAATIACITKLNEEGPTSCKQPPELAEFSTVPTPLPNEGDTLLSLSVTGSATNFVLVSFKKSDDVRSVHARKVGRDGAVGPYSVGCLPEG